MYIEAEARFLRAFFYWELAQRWGGVVLYKSTPATVDDYKIAKSTEDETFAFIAEDLAFAVANLPDNAYSSGHAMKTSALALQARIALFQGKYDDVINTYQRDYFLTCKLHISNRFKIYFCKTGRSGYLS